MRVSEILVKRIHVNKRLDVPSFSFPPEAVVFSHLLETLTNKHTKFSNEILNFGSL